MAAVPRFVRENEELVEASLRTTYSGQVEEEMMIINHDDRLSQSELVLWDVSWYL